MNFFTKCLYQLLIVLSMIAWASNSITAKTASCPTDVEYSLRYDIAADVYRVYMRSTNTLPNNTFTSTALVTVIAPFQGGVEIVQADVISAISGASWDIQAPAPNSLSGNEDRFSFTLSNSVSTIPFVANQEVELFSFINSGACAEPTGLRLYEEGAPYFDTNTDAQGINSSPEWSIIGCSNPDDNALIGNYGILPVNIPAPVLTSQLTSTDVCVNGGTGIVTLNVAANNVNTYSWYGVLDSPDILSTEVNDVLLSTTTIGTLNTLATYTSYYVILQGGGTSCASDPSLSVSSNVVTPIVNEMPTIVGQPTDQVLCTTAQFATFSITTNPANLQNVDYEWYRVGTPDVSVGTGSTLLLPIMDTGVQAGDYYVIATGSGSCVGQTVQSNLANLSFQEPPTITVDVPTTTTACQSDEVTLQVTAENAGSFGWYKVQGNPDISSLENDDLSVGSTNPLVIPNVSVTSQGEYYLIVNGAGGCSQQTVNSTITTLTVDNLSAPTLPMPQSFCMADNPTIADLQATGDVGSSIVWYNVPTGGIPLASSTSLSNSQYFAAQILNGCESINRLSVTVTISNPAAPALLGGDNFENFCEIDQPTLADFTVVNIDPNNTLLWYAAESGGAPLASSTSLTNGGKYFAAQIIDGCESIGRTGVFSFINNLAAPTTFDDTQDFCDVENPTVMNLDASGVSGATILWYSEATGGTPLAINTPLVNGNTYYATQIEPVNNCESSTRLEVTVSVNTVSPPTATSNQPFCTLDNPIITDLEATGTGLIVWYETQVGGTPIADNTPLIINTYYAGQIINGCESASRVPVVVTLSTAITWYQDNDNDGVGNFAVSMVTCTPPSGFVTLSGDCNDNNENIYPNAPELCDNMDNDCDGDTDEGLSDNDNDNICDAIDLDDDNDGISDIVEGVNTDSDNDNIPDRLDLDSDNDGIPDIIEAGGIDTNNDGLVDDPTDPNQNGWAGINDSTEGGTPLPDPDSDNDNIPNRIDLDSDNDGIYDILEAGGIDNDNDGLVDNPTDPNQNGWAGINDGVDGGTALPDRNSDTPADNLPNRIDTDSDNDGCFDVVEAGFVDGNMDGLLGIITPPTVNINGVVTSGNGYTGTTPDVIIPLQTPQPSSNAVDFCSDESPTVTDLLTKVSLLGGNYLIYPVGSSTPLGSSDLVTGGGYFISQTQTQAGGVCESNQVEVMVNIITPAPLILQPASTTVCSATDEAMVFFEFGSLPSNAVVISQSNNSGDLFPVGTHTVSQTIMSANGAMCTIISNPFTIEEVVGIAITNQPQSQAICEGNTATFQVTATDAEGYQWLFNNQIISGATNPSYVIPSVSEANEGSYTVQLTNSCLGTLVTSESALLTVNVIPEFTVHPQNVCNDLNVTLFATVDEPSAVISWEFALPGSSVYSPLPSIEGEDGYFVFNNDQGESNMLIISNAVPGYSDYQYRAVATSSVCMTTITSNSAIVCGSMTLLPRVCLGGTYDPNTQLMRDDLRVKNFIPFVEPYTALPDFSHSGDGGGETAEMTAFIDRGTNSVVDWVFVELRDGTNPETVITSRAGFVQRDGDIVDVDGESALSFNVIPGNYFVSVRHRNHLGVMTATPVNLELSGTIVDFTDSNIQTWGESALHEYLGFGQPVGTGKLCLRPGNGNGNNQIVHQGRANDVNMPFTQIANAQVTSEDFAGDFFINFQFPGYHVEDYNMDGFTVFQGAGNDVDVVFFSITTHPINVEKFDETLIYIIREQIPGLF